MTNRIYSLHFYILYAVVLVLTLGFVFFCPEQFSTDGSTDYLKILYTAAMSALICAAFTIHTNELSKRVKLIVSLIMLILLPLYITAVIMYNFEIRLFRLWIFNCLIYFVFAAVLSALTARPAFATAVTAVIFFFAYALNTEVYLFRDTPIVPADIFAVNTAISVADNYSFRLTYDLVISFQGTVLWCILAYKFNTAIRGLYKRIIMIAAAVIFTVLYFKFLSYYFEENNPDTLHYDKYDTAVSNERFGTALTFWLNAKRMIIQKPEGYSLETAEAVLEEYPSISGTGEKPNIVVVMDEAFSDLTGVYELETDKDVLPNFNSLRENTVKGNMLVSVFGGNTCITEFEFLTGITDGILNTDTNAFVQCVSQPLNSLCYDLKEEGYTNIALHPFWKDSWRRNSVYPLLGFDECIFAENFGDEVERNSSSMRSKPYFGSYDYVRGYLSDSDSFKKIEELFENKTEDEKLFVFNVTIQNHGGYTYDGDDFENQVHAVNEGSEELDQYLTLASMSDKAIGELISYFEEYNEPTVVVIFGDHQPNVSFERNAREEFEYLGSDARYIVPFAVWANYDIEENYIELTSPAYLSCYLKEAAGLPLTSWDNFRKELLLKYPALTLRSIYNSSGEEVDMTAQRDELYLQYKFLQYAFLFDGLMTR